MPLQDSCLHEPGPGVTASAPGCRRRVPDGRLTRPIIRACLGLGLLLTLSACPGAGSRLSPQAEAGREIYLARSCKQCHGDQRQGTRSAPPLIDLAQAWDAQSLGEFLLDPRSKEGDSARLTALNERYLVEMPAIRGLSQDQLDALVAYMLSDP